MNWLALLLKLGEAITPLVQAYMQARKLAEQAGDVTPEQLAAADARWQKVYTDPLAGTGTAEPPA